MRSEESLVAVVGSFLVLSGLLGFFFYILIWLPLKYYPRTQGYMSLGEATVEAYYDGR